MGLSWGNLCGHNKLALQAARGHRGFAQQTWHCSWENDVVNQWMSRFPPIFWTNPCDNRVASLKVSPWQVWSWWTRRITTSGFKLLGWQVAAPFGTLAMSVYSVLWECWKCRSWRAPTKKEEVVARCSVVETTACAAVGKMWHDSMTLWMLLLQVRIPAAMAKCLERIFPLFLIGFTSLSVIMWFRRAWLVDFANCCPLRSLGMMANCCYDSFKRVHWLRLCSRPTRGKKNEDLSASCQHCGSFWEGSRCPTAVNICESSAEVSCALDGEEFDAHLRPEMGYTAVCSKWYHACDFTWEGKLSNHHCAAWWVWCFLHCWDTPTTAVLLFLALMAWRVVMP